MGADIIQYQAQQDPTEALVRRLLEADEMARIHREVLLSMAAMIKDLKRENQELTEHVVRVDERIEHITGRVEPRLLAMETRMAHGEGKDGWVVQSELGRAFRVNLGPVYVGRLLAAVGLAKRVQTNKGLRTVPTYLTWHDRGIAESYTTPSGHTNYRWNARKALERIDEWMMEHNYWETYVSLQRNKDMEKFINVICLKHGSVEQA